MAELYTLRVISTSEYIQYKAWQNLASIIGFSS